MTISITNRCHCHWHRHRNMKWRPISFHNPFGNSFLSTFCMWMTNCYHQNRWIDRDKISSSKAKCLDYIFFVPCHQPMKRKNKAHFPFESIKINWIDKKCCTFTNICPGTGFSNRTLHFVTKYFMILFQFNGWIAFCFRYDKNRPSYTDHDKLVGQEENDNFSLCLRRICSPFIWHIFI